MSEDNRADPRRAIVINTADDERIAAFVNIRERDLVGRDGLFIAEGEVVLRMLMASHTHRPQAVFLHEKRLPKLMPALEGLGADVPVYTASQDVMDEIAGFHLHRGILAVGKSAPDEGAGALLARLPPRALVLVLVGIANHDNVGGLFRNAAAFGVDAVLLDAESCDPFYRKAIRVSAGAVLTMPFARFGENEDVLATLNEHGFAAYALSPSGQEELANAKRPDRAAVLMGAEGPGLPPDILARARTVRIRMAHGFDSLNVATAGGIALYHFANG